MPRTKMKSVALKVSKGLFVLLEPFFEVLFYLWIGVGLLVWLAYRLVRQAPQDRICENCKQVHTEICPCCSWICPVSDRKEEGLS